MESTTTAERGLSLDSIDLPNLANRAKQWAYLNGLMMRSADQRAAVHAPLAVLPCPFPRSSFDQAVAVMPLMNELYDAVSRDSEFLMSTLKSAAEFDDFTARLLEIYSEVRDRQTDGSDVTLGIHRSDYMLDEPSGRLLQIELNTIASSFGSLSCQVSKMHSHLISTTAVLDYERDRVVHNPARDDISTALAEAHRAVGFEDSVILMVAADDDTNLYDQQWIVLTLLEEHGVACIRKSLSAMMDCSCLDDSGNLIVDGKLISVVYYRSGYSPKSYPTGKEWEARRRIELSTACKCPSISYHLTGTKKIQQELAKPGRLEKYLSADACSQVRAFFAGLWGLDNSSDPDMHGIITDATNNPSGYVLKPQREGGGNNLYGDEAAAVLSKGKGLAAYVLMERIRPKVHQSLLLRNEQHSVEETISELGIYGTFLKKDNKILLNKSAGHLLRTKVSSSDEGGVAAGFAVLDSPYLID